MRYGLIGEKLEHSYSKLIHEKLGHYSYELIPLAPEELEPFIKEGRWQGLNVTIPYKEAVLSFCDRLSERARQIGSVNTLVRGADGSVFGDNTDYEGFLFMARQAGIDFRDQKVLILGSGGTSMPARGSVPASSCRQCATSPAGP